MSKPITLVSIFMLVPLLAVSCGKDIDLEPDEPPDAATAPDATPPADAVLPDASLPTLGTCVPRDSIDPPGSGECLAPEISTFDVEATIAGDDWYMRKAAAASCSVFNVSVPSSQTFVMEMSCEQTAGDPFDDSQPVTLRLSDTSFVLPPQLVAGERFALRVAEFRPDEDDSPELHVTMRSEVDGALWFASSAGTTLVPHPELLERLAVTAEEWLAPLIVESVTGVCPTAPDGFDTGTVERAAVDIAVPGSAPLRLVDRRTAHLADTYRLEVGSMSHYTRPDVPDAWPSQRLLLGAIELCAE